MSPQKKRLNWHWLYIIDAVFLLVAVCLVIFGLQAGDKKDTATCGAPGRTHEIRVENETFSPKSLEIARCDTLRITNQDERTFQFAFGIHDKHIDYPGFTESTVGPRETISIHAVQAGEYHMHDHLRDRASIDLVIRDQ